MPSAYYDTMITMAGRGRARNSFEAGPEGPELELIIEG
jgi:hypothetical protein